MSVISKKIFNGANHYITSPYGKRKTISTSAGSTASFHYGTDYGTNGKKIPQYAIEDGYVFNAQRAKDRALYVWVIYPRIKKAFLHYHLDSYKVRAGQSVKSGTLLGYTGKTGKATGVHLHLGIRDLTRLSDSQIKHMTWALLQSCAYIDPEKFASTYEPPMQYKTGTYKVTANVLNVRSGAGTEYPIKTFGSFTQNARAQILKLNSGKSCNGYVKGVVCTVSKIGNDVWGKTPSGWICLKYCEAVKP